MWMGAPCSGQMEHDSDTSLPLHKRGAAFGICWLAAFLYGAYLTLGIWILNPFMGLWCIAHASTGLMRIAGYYSSNQMPDHRLMVLAWLPFLLVTAIGLVVRNRVVFYLFLAVFCGLVVVNFVGCRMIMSDPVRLP